MQKSPERPVWETGIFCLLLMLAAVLRVHDYNKAPQLSENADEVAWAWAGQSLIENHSPTSWSFLPAYPDWFPITASYGRTLPGVHPWLDQPPLFALMIGETAIRAGQTAPEQVDAAAIRIPVIALSLLSLYLLWRLGRRLTSKSVALFGVLLLAVSPAAVSGARVVESEALLAPILLATLLLAHRLNSRKGGMASWVALAALLIAAPLVKVPGITFGFIIAVIFLATKRWIPALISVCASVLGFALFVGYGALVNWQQFTKTLAVDGARRQGAEGAFQFITSTRAGWSDSIPVHDAWWSLGWLGIAAVAFLFSRSRKSLYLAWPAIAYAASMAIMASPQVTDRYGWYRLAIYPLVYLMAAWLIGKCAQHRSVGGSVLVLALAGAMTFNYFGTGSLVTSENNGLGNNMGAQPPALLLLALGVVLVVPVVVALWKPRKPLEGAARVAMGAGLAAIIFVSVYASWDLAELYRQL